MLEHGIDKVPHQNHGIAIAQVKNRVSPVKTFF